MVNRYVGAGQKLMDLVIKKIPRKKKVSPTIKSVKPTKLRFKESIKKSKDAEYRKRYQALDKAEDKLKTGKKMMKEGQKERKKLVDTKRAFEFQNIRSFHAVQPGKSKRKDLIKKPTPDKKFKTAKQMEKDERRKREKEPFMGGGMAGRRFGFSEGKLAVTPREKQLAAQYGDKKRITRGDVITAAKSKSGKRMQASVGGGAGQTSREKILFQLNKNIKNVREKMGGRKITRSQEDKLRDIIKKRKKP